MLHTVSHQGWRQAGEGGSRARREHGTALLISICCVMTGIFAIAGALYRWGEGPLFTAPAGVETQLYYAELLVCGPASILAGIGYRRLERWGMLAAVASAGIYIYGSVMVYVSIFQAGFPLPVHLVIPPIFGIALAIVTLWWSCKHPDLFH